MKAAYYEGNRTIRIDACAPVAPAAGQVQIQVSHCGICGSDLHLFHGDMDHRVHIPHVFGHEMAGTILKVGEGVGGFAPGDPVTVRPLDPCGTCPACRAGNSHVCQRLKFIGIDAPGALQTSWTVPAHTLHRLPASLSLHDAALVEPLAVACHDVRLAGVEAGEYVVVQGGGPIGTLIALVCQHEGARALITEVNPFRLKLAHEFGLDALNPKEADVVKHVTDQTGTAGADVVFEVSGSPGGAELMTKLARVRGRIVIVAIFSEVPRVNLFQFFWRELRLLGARVYEPQDFEKAIALIASGSLPLPRLVTEVCPLEDLESALHRLESGGQVMKILVRCSDSTA
ncbi:MAG TPA: alcohol dehydrogenase catalytic domain-containing protein [Terriglobia bacterium]|nr:alcohol dehydrogenase catalytic domain-containing protein [Terriglobia bacterium]